MITKLELNLLFPVCSDGLTFGGGQLSLEVQEASVAGPVPGSTLSSVPESLGLDMNP